MAERIRVVCLECGKKFTIVSTADPQCPKCGGVDLELQEDRS